MIEELPRAQFDRIRPLLAGLPHTCAADAVVDGTCGGQVWVDAAARPRCALVATPEGHYVVGDDQNEEFLRSLRSLIADTLLPRGRAEGWIWVLLRSTSDGWGRAMEQMLEGIACVKDDGEFHACERVGFDWRAAVPPGFRVQQADATRLARTDLTNIDRVAAWAEGNFGSIPAFLAHGFAFCTLHGDDVASWSVSDCVSDGRCEIGIHTDERYRRRGLATLTAAAAVDHALSRGLKSVGWHCVRHNVGSSATARKVGFRKVLDYREVKICIAEADNHVVNGNLALLRREFGLAAECFGRALRAAESQPVGGADSRLLDSMDKRARYCFEAACAAALAGDRASAMESLSDAVEASTLRQKGF